MNVREVRDIDGVDIVLMLSGMVVGGAVMFVVRSRFVPTWSAGLIPRVAVLSGVAAILVRRMVRKRPPATPDVEPPVVGARSLLSGVLMGVGALVALLGLGGLALVALFLTSPEGKQAGDALDYLLVPAAVVATGAGMIWAGRARPRAAPGP
jgi:hypothetical protein